MKTNFDKGHVWNYFHIKALELICHKTILLKSLMNCKRLYKGNFTMKFYKNTIGWGGGQHNHIFNKNTLGSFKFIKKHYTFYAKDF